MTRLRGRALGGERLLARIPHGHYQTGTLISGTRLEGACAPWLFDGPMNGERFWAWVRKGLAPTLRPGELVILDNLATHKVRGVRASIEAVGARLLYLPPYSPDFNPIESMGSKVKQSLRSHAPRTQTDRLRTAKKARFPPPIARASFLALDTLHDKWKCASPGATEVIPQCRVRHRPFGGALKTPRIFLAKSGVIHASRFLIAELT